MAIPKALKTLRYHATSLAVATCTIFAMPSHSAIAQEKIIYLFPAPPILPGFAPIRLAHGKGYFKEAGFDVELQSTRGGVEVAKQVGAGNVPFGNITADAPIIVRGNGIPVKIVAVFGGSGLFQTVVREDSGITKPADLKGKTITVLSYQDSGYYALLGLLASVGMTQNDLSIQAAGPAGVWESVANGRAAGMSGVPDWIPPIQAAGVQTKIIKTDEFFPHMSMGIGVSDQLIKERPEMVQRFVSAALRGLKDIMDDPNKAAEDFVSIVPEWKGREQSVKTIFRYYAALVYPGQKRLGEIDVERLSKLQDFYLKSGIIQKKNAVDELFTNQFIVQNQK